MLLDEVTQNWRKEYLAKFGGKADLENKEEIAKNLFAMNMSLEQVMQATGLPRDVAETIQLAQK